MSKIIPYLLVLLLIITICVQNIHAQELSTAIAPQQYEIAAKPGSSITLPYTVTNIGDPSIYTVHVYDVTPSSTSSEFSLTEINEVSDIQVNTSSSSFRIGTPLLLTSDEAIEFDIIIDVPETEYQKEYVLAVIAESDPPEGFEDSNRILLQAGTGSLVIISVSENGEREEMGETRMFAARTEYYFSLRGKTYQLSDSNKPIPLTLRIGNIGKNSFTTSGNIVVKEQWGDGSSITIPSQRVYANSERLLSTDDSTSHTAMLPGRFINILKVQAYVTAGSQSVKPETLTIIIFPFTISLLSGAVFITLISTYLLMKYVKGTRTTQKR